MFEFNPLERIEEIQKEFRQRLQPALDVLGSVDKRYADALKRAEEKYARFFNSFSSQSLVWRNPYGNLRPVKPSSSKCEGCLHQNSCISCKRLNPNCSEDNFVAKSNVLP